MKQFFETLPSNHWSNYFIFFLGLFATLYYFYFYFSKEGKDERGRAILAKASFFGFVSSTILVFCGSLFYEVATTSFTSYIWVLIFIWMVNSLIVVLGIFILKKSQ